MKLTKLGDKEMKFKHKYRIITDVYNGFECQIKKWYFPFFWFQLWHTGSVNSFVSEREAREFIEMHRKPIIVGS